MTDMDHRYNPDFCAKCGGDCESSPTDELLSTTTKEKHMPAIIYSTNEVNVVDLDNNDDYLVINPDRLDDFDYTFNMINVVMDTIGAVADGPDTMRVITNLATAFLAAHGEEIALTMDRYV